ncbi:hypothetical protein Agabi119p4_9244 [Agaricus bisporus var. burnettii]|uniref:Fungal-type protein kinase domain-containing protein n=1 Tax=Agaricus bisporus var. burnettii TaxID=192524 RepID=A0A8H7C638_AGABI|nr:hypothetical protein Agabi119p4_9244 [Agaricus bisporus var. burnettii]
MANEILQYSLKDFLDHYAPWPVPAATVNNVYMLYVEDHKRNAPLVTKTEQDHEDTAPNYRAFADFETEPTNATNSESTVFKDLEDIVYFLREQKVESELAEIKRTPLLCYRYCTASEVSGTNIRMDAYLTEELDGASENAESRPERVDLAYIAVPIEFKEHLKDRVQNRHHLITDALEILNDDPCRTWIYGLAIENTVMSIWYFSRSHTVVSTSFDFTKDIKSFIYVFLSLMYATRVEIGYDPTVHRVLEDKRIRYVYEVEYNGETRYFKTLETLYTSRVLRITVRKTRVWKAIEVEGYDDKKFRKEKKGGKVVALKDYWLDEGSKSEKDTLEDIFRSLEQVKHKPTTLKWAKSEFHQNFFREQLEEERYRKYFMGIECDMVLAATKPRLPSAQPVPDFLVPEENTEPASVNKATGSIQTSDSVFELAYMIYQRGGRTSLKRKYRTKRHHRLIYEQVGRPLLAATNLSTSLRSLTDALIALTFIYIAGYVHRDVSTGNTIFVEESNGTIMGKLSDMEYAKVFQNDESNSDPKTGTLFFMAIEIHSGKSLYVAPDNEDDIRSESPPPSFDLAPRNQDLRNSFLEPAENLHPGKQMRPKFRFSHDMESWMWVTLYILTRRIPRQDVGQRDDHRDQFFNHVYTNSNVPTNEREQVIRMEDHKFQSFLEYHFPPAITGFAKHLAFFRKELKSSYIQRARVDDMFNPDTYVPIYEAALRACRYLKSILIPSLELDRPAHSQKVNTKDNVLMKSKMTMTILLARTMIYQWRIGP